MIVKTGKFLTCLVAVSQKAVSLIKEIRSSKDLLSLLVQEKTGDEKNPRFTQDFKTLADVLVQQLVCFHLDSEFPGFGVCCYGEETETFTNALGEEVKISLHSNNLAKDLGLLVGQNEGEHLAQIVQSPLPHVDHVTWTHPLSLDQLSVWIDPIDGTGQYISGDLNVVTLLIGAFDRTTGNPVLGLVQRPFTGDLYFATTDPVALSPSLLKTALCERTLLLGVSTAFNRSIEGVSLVRMPGAGVKITLVATGELDGCILLGVYPWDVCGPHALVKAIGGGICHLAEPHTEVTYSTSKVKMDIIVFRNMQVQQALLQALHHTEIVTS